MENTNRAHTDSLLQQTLFTSQEVQTGSQTFFTEHSAFFCFFTGLFSVVINVSETNTVGGVKESIVLATAHRNTC